MIEIIETGSNRVIGLRISGRIEKSDMDRVVQATEEKFALADKLGIFVEVESFGGISFEALMEDIRFAFPNLKRFDKKAVVSDKQWHGTMARISDKLFPGIEVRHFAPEQREEALRWLA